MSLSLTHTHIVPLSLCGSHCIFAHLAALSPFFPAQTRFATARDTAAPSRTRTRTCYKAMRERERKSVRATPFVLPFFVCRGRAAVAAADSRTVSGVGEQNWGRWRNFSLLFEGHSVPSLLPPPSSLASPQTLPRNCAKQILDLSGAHRTVSQIPSARRKKGQPLINCCFDKGVPSV